MKITEKDYEHFYALSDAWKNIATKEWENFAKNTFEHPYKADSSKVTSSKIVKFPEWTFENFLRLQINEKKRISCILPVTLLKHLQRSYNWRVAECIYRWLKECLQKAAKNTVWVTIRI
jgi:hypothetical protein